MKCYDKLLQWALGLAGAGLFLGVFLKAGGWTPLDVAPLSCLRFAGVCFLGAMALSLAEIAAKTGKQEPEKKPE